MPRHTSPSSKPVPDITDLAAVKRGSLAADAAALADDQLQSIAPMLMAIGQNKAFAFMANVSDMAALQTFHEMQRLFPTIRGKSLPLGDGRAYVFEDFDSLCKAVLGRGHRRMQQIAAAVNVLGEDLYESSKSIGFSARDYQALTALPPPDQKAIKETLASGDHEKAVDLVHQLARRVSDERKRADEAEKREAAKQQLIDRKNTDLDALRDELEARYKAGPDALAAEQLAALQAATVEITNRIPTFVKTIDAVMAAAGSEAVALAARQSLDYVCQCLVDASARLGLSINLADAVMPETMTADALSRGFGRN